MPPDVLATLADRYQIEQTIGAGGMATVYAALDTRHDRRVAVKILRPELARTIGGERFLREIAVIARLQHPHILGLIDSGMVDGLPYYVMPLINGASLRARIVSERELPLDDGIRVLRQVLDALAYAHAQGIIHRDIKPENVLLSGYAPRTGSSSGRWHAMVADFGVAKALTEAGADPALTATGMSIGTPGSMSPEQAAGDPHIDHRSDIYALGAMAYEIFAGVPPFSGSTAQHLIAAHMTRTPALPSIHRPAIPLELDKFVLRCMEKNPADRWQTADDALARLDAIAGSVEWQEKQRHPAEHPVNIIEARYRLTEKVCRQLDRANLDPRIIGADLQYADNQLASDVLLVLLHGTGQDHSVFRDLMTELPYRCVAPTLIGFEPRERSRVSLPLVTHTGIMRAFVGDTIETVKPGATILIGFSAGADIALLCASQSKIGVPAIDGIVSLGANLSFETCFVTRMWSLLGSDDEKQMLDDLQRFGSGARTLEEWIKIHEYLVNTFRKFGSHVATVRHFSQDIVRTFEEGGDDTFVTLFRESSRSVAALRCVWEESEISVQQVQALRMRNLDSGILGERYRDDSLIIEAGAAHFDLLAPQRVRKHVDDVLRIISEGPTAPALRSH